MFNVVTELIVGDNAHLRYVCGQELSARRSWIFGAQRAEVGRDGVARLGRARLRLGARPGADGDAARRRGRRGAGHRRVRDPRLASTSTSTRPRSTLRRTRPRISRSAASCTGRSTAVWKGNIIVDPGAQKTDAFQESRNLLLSKRAHADAIPGLEIQANDVRCTHAAAVAQVDPEQLFYLRSHGLPEEVAKRLVIEGFLAALVERFEQGPVRDVLAETLERRLALILGD